MRHDDGPGPRVIDLVPGGIQRLRRCPRRRLPRPRCRAQRLDRRRPPGSHRCLAPRVFTAPRRRPGGRGRLLGERLQLVEQRRQLRAVGPGQLFALDPGGDVGQRRRPRKAAAPASRGERRHASARRRAAPATSARRGRRNDRAARSAAPRALPARSRRRAARWRWPAARRRRRGDGRFVGRRRQPLRSSLPWAVSGSSAAAPAPPAPCRGQPPAQPFGDRRGGDGGNGAGVRHRIAHERGPAGARHAGHRRGATAGSGRRRLDLAGIDPDTADLDLVVDAARGRAAAGARADAVAGAEEAAAVARGRRSARRWPGAAEVAAASPDRR